MDTPSGKERIAPLIYWSKGILREDMQEFLIGKLCPDTSISELFKLLSLPFFSNFLRFDYDDASIASLLYNVPLAYGKRFENCHNEGDLHANVPCRLLLYGENEFLLSSFFDDKAKYSCLKNNGSIAETLT